MVLMGEKRAVFQFKSVKVGLVVAGHSSAFSLHRSRKSEIVWSGGQREISSRAGTNSLNSFVVDVSNFSGTALVLTLLLFLFLLQEIFFQCEGFNALVVGQRICGNVERIIWEKNSCTYPILILLCCDFLTLQPNRRAFRSHLSNLRLK